ncbi:DUF2255 family protein [Actinomycetota bacterium]
MTDWNASDIAKIAATEEIHVLTRRKDGTLRRPRIIWVVTDGAERVFIRSANGRDADWFRWAIATGQGALEVGGTTYDVTWSEVDDDGDLTAADNGHRTKYGRYASIVADLVTPRPRSATLEVFPA